MTFEKRWHLSRRELRVCLLALALGFAPGYVRAQSADGCGPSPAVKAALDQLPRQTPALTDWQFHEQHVAAIQALLRQYVDDVFVQRAYIRSMRSTSETDKAIAEFKARHEQNPDNPQLAYLYGLTLVGRQSPEAVKLFGAALEREPKFAWPHLELVTVYSSPAFLNKEQSVSHLKAFVDACPASLEGYEALTRIGDTDLLRPHAGRLRTLLQTRNDPDAVGAYRTLWSVEFKVHPASEYDGLRRQVGQDVERLRHLDLEDKLQWYQALEDGYKLVNDQKQADWARDQRLARFPQPWELAGMTEWWNDHPSPGDDAPPDTKRAFYTDLLAQTGKWLKERPNTTFIWSDRLEAMEHLDDVSAADVEAAVDRSLQVAASNAGPEGSESRYYLSAAEILAKKHLEPQRVVEIAQKGLAQWEIEAKEPHNDLYATKERVDNSKFYMASSRLELLGYEIDGYLQLKQADKAQFLLAQLDQGLQDFKLLVGEKQERKKTFAGWLAGYWGRRAREAGLEGRKLDAMGFYENALLTRLDAQQKPETGQKDELADNAHRLWTSLGGTEDGWQLWYGRPANALANQPTLTWEDAHEPMPSFELADVSGKGWNTASLKGKVTFLNFWASW
jgi:hypothetical protein